jgi:hypothetical protein
VKCTWVAFAVGLLLVLLSAQGLAAGGRAGRGRRDSRREGKLKVGDEAADFELKRLGAEGSVKLSSFKGKRPVVLVFGSYT